jgi:nitroreductase
VIDLAKTGNGQIEQRKEWASLDVGYISQNVYLYCASAGLATGARGSLDKTAIGQRLSLRPDQQVVLAQSVGFSKDLK